MRTALSMKTLVLLVLTTTSSGLHAQAQPGQDVRWKADHVTRRAVFREVLPGGRILVDLTDSTIVLDPAATEIEYRNGSRTTWGSAGIGIAVGGLIGVVMIPASKWIPLRPDAGPAVALLVEPQRLGVSMRF